MEHKKYHESAKLAASEAVAGAINYVREVHGAKILEEFPTLISDYVEAHSRIYSAQIIANTTRGSQE